MPTGSCFCGNIKIEFTGEPAMLAICHCSDCRKISGGNYSNNIVVPSSNFKVTQGSPVEFTSTADSGRSITSKFCQNCGTTVFRYGDSFGGPDGMKIVKAGVLDDSNAINSYKPTMELYVAKRVPWVAAVDGAVQFDTMPPS